MVQLLGLLLSLVQESIDVGAIYSLRIDQKGKSSEKKFCEVFWSFFVSTQIISTFLNIFSNHTKKRFKKKQNTYDEPGFSVSQIVKMQPITRQNLATPSRTLPLYQRQKNAFVLNAIHHDQANRPK